MEKILTQREEHSVNNVVSLVPVSSGDYRPGLLLSKGSMVYK